MANTLIAIIPANAPRPRYNLPDDVPYRLTQLATQRSTNDALVYVSAADAAKLGAFRLDYPSAEIRQNAELSDPAGWDQNAFPEERGNNPLEKYLNGLRRDAAASARRDARRGVIETPEEIKTQQVTSQDAITDLIPAVDTKGKKK